MCTHLGAQMSQIFVSSSPTLLFEMGFLNKNLEQASAANITANSLF